MNTPIHNTVSNVPLNLHVWRCKACHMQLGTLNPDHTELQIKYKDLFVYVKGGICRTICRKCGTENILMDDDADIDIQPIS